MTLDEEAISKGWSNYNTYLYHARNRREKEEDAAYRREQSLRRAELERRRTAGALPGNHVFTIVVGADDEAARAALAERAENYRQAAEQAAPEPEGDGGAS